MPKAKKKQPKLKPTLSTADFCAQARRRVGGIRNNAAGGGAVYTYLGALFTVLVPFLGCFAAGPVVCAYARAALGGAATPKELFGAYKENYKKFSLLHLINYVFTVLWGMLLIVPGVLKAMAYRMSYFILAEHPELTPWEAHKASVKLMKGHERDLLILMATFTGWAILSALTLGVLGCWLAPYREAAIAAFYEDLREETAFRTALAKPQEKINGESNGYEIASGDDIILEVRGLKKYFPIQTNLFGKPLRFLRAVDDVSMSVKAGTAIGVVGESGCGKTTLGRTILKLYEANGGTIRFAGEDITNLSPKQMRKYRTDMQLIFQDPYSSLPPRMTVGAIISEGVRVHNIVPKDQVHEYVLGIMKKCGLQPQYYDRYPHEFSGGQRQRICIARALAVKPRLVICDEPVSALDVSIQAQIINLLKELQTTMGLTYVFISHDLSVVKYITNQIMVMYLGNVMELGATEEIFANPLHPYTKALFSAVPVPDPDAKAERIILEGDIPSPANPPSGCKFHTRCSKCMGICEFLAPVYVEAEEGHYVACHLHNPAAMAQREELEAEYAKLKSEREARIKHGRKQAVEAEERKED